MNYGGPERRGAERLRKQFTIRMRKITGSIISDWDLVLLKDISKSSVSFQYGRSFREGDLLELKISIGTNVEPVICRGEVARVDSGGPMAPHEVAVVFVDINPSDVMRIEKIIEEARK